MAIFYRNSGLGRSVTRTKPRSKRPQYAIHASADSTQRLGRATSPLSVNSNDEKEKNSLDFTQRIEKKLTEYNTSDNVFKRWLFELVSLFVSAACMITIIWIYIRIKDQPLSQYNPFLTWINVLGKVSSAALIVPTSEALGQLKWNWFHNSRAMWDFEIFDKASRGPLGALMLLYRTKGRSLAALGAVLIVLMLAIDTFFQQVVDLPGRWTLNDSPGLLPRTIRYEPTIVNSTVGGVLFVADDKDMFLVVSKFQYGNGTQPVPFGNASRPDIPITCPTSNCTWPVYDTLAVCSKCQDFSEYLEFACMTQRVDWTSSLNGGFMVEDDYPNATMCGYFLNATSENPVLMSGYIVDPATSARGEALLMRNFPLSRLWTYDPFFGNGSVYFKELRNTLLDAVTVSAADGTAASVYRNETPIALECVLTWCVKSIKSSYNSGEYEEEVLETFFNTTAGPFPYESVIFSDGTDVTYGEDINIDIGLSLSGRNISGYGTSNESILPISAGFTDMFPSFTLAMNESDIPKLRYFTWELGPARNQILGFNPWLAPNNVTRHMERFATAMTNVVRSVGGKGEMVAGDAWKMETFVSVQWAWLTFPLLLLILSFVFLILTMMKTSDKGSIGVWKTSAMPTLIYSLPKETQGQFTKSSTFNSTKATKKVRIKLSPNLGWRVSGASHLSTSPQLPRPVVQAPRGWI
ncbi:hypothetical protein BDW02DRAFT_509094 [Decorospora gaudefroyi]|uniref:DUF3176 domain containing protein n=1 Tax=Decorospora gaudefroyi TaxID=184978 RepID=A0A6A5K148_9PLEO|nr:hypothetical protein BDW02DRAFT_509094 [Decorospora gaudefroyi]